MRSIRDEFKFIVLNKFSGQNGARRERMGRRNATVVVVDVIAVSWALNAQPIFLLRTTAITVNMLSGNDTVSDSESEQHPLTLKELRKSQEKLHHRLSELRRTQLHSRNMLNQLTETVVKIKQAEESNTQDIKRILDAVLKLEKDLARGKYLLVICSLNLTDMYQIQTKNTCRQLQNRKYGELITQDLHLRLYHLLQSIKRDGHPSHLHLAISTSLGSTRPIEIFLRVKLSRQWNVDLKSRFLTLCACLH